MQPLIHTKKSINISWKKTLKVMLFTEINEIYIWKRLHAAAMKWNSQNTRKIALTFENRFRYFVDASLKFKTTYFCSINRKQNRVTAASTVGLLLFNSNDN